MIRITLRAARVNAGLTLVEASSRFGLSPDTLAKYEKDSTDVSRTFVYKVEEIYKIPTEFIFFGKQSEFFRILNETA